MPEILIRLATLPELPTIQALNQQLFEEELTRDPLLDTSWPFSPEGYGYFTKLIELKGIKSICLVAEVEGKSIGYLAGSMRSIDGTRPVKRAELENTLVLPEFRGIGIGTKLYGAFSEWATSQGAELLVVHAYSNNAEALAFYEKRGFREISKVLEQPL